MLRIVRRKGGGYPACDRLPWHLLCSPPPARRVRSRAGCGLPARRGADLVLLPEYVNGEMVPEPLEGPSARLMSAKAREYRMLVAGTIARRDAPVGRLRNTALLFELRNYGDS